MTDLRINRHEPGARVIVTMPDDTRLIGTISSYEDGRDLDRRHGGPYVGYVYEVEIDGRLMRVGEERLEAAE